MCKGEKQILQADDVLQGKEVFRDKLESMREKGVALFLEGEPSTPAEIAVKCVREDSCYMADYVIDDNGRLTQVRYDKVSLL